MFKSFAFAALATTTALVAAPAAQAAQTINASGAGMVIPFGTSTQTSTINLTNAGAVSSVMFTLDFLAHTAARDLSIFVTHNGVTAALLDCVDDLRGALGTYEFTSSATKEMKDGNGLLVINPGTYKYSYTTPGSFLGQSVAGDWTLTVADKGLLTPGLLKGWGLSVQAVPEPATWAMMIAGFALVGSSMRRRANAVAFA